jgi:hypothetical protein
MSHDVVRGRAPPIGPELCRILYLDFAEFPFHDIHAFHPAT